MEISDKFTRDAEGQWWYALKNGRRTRASVVECPNCGEDFLRARCHSKVRTCSKACAHRLAGRGTGRKVQNGYVRVYWPKHPDAAKDGWIREHRLVMAETLGRRLLPTERVHHRNGDPLDNRPENLELWLVGHPAGQRADDLPHCPTCTCGR